MSLESAKLFLTEMKGNAEFFAKFEKAKSDEERKEIAKALGYDFTKEEFMECASTDVELTDADLEKVAGGKSAGWIAVGVGVVGLGAAGAA